MEPEALPGMRATKPDNLHLTLHFIGDAEPEPLTEALGAISSLVAPFDLTFAGVGRFGGRGRGLILWVGVEPSAAISRLYCELGRLLSSAGVGVDTRPYAPHVTIARSQRSRASDVDEFLELHRDYASTIRVEAVCLVSSVPQFGGSVYTVERSYPLQGP